MASHAPSLLDGIFDLPTARAKLGLGSLSILNAAPAGTLTGTTLAATVTGSSLTSAAGGSFGTAAFAATGTSGHTLGFLDGTNAWTGPQAYGGAGYINLTAPNAWTGGLATQAPIFGNYQYDGTYTGGTNGYIATGAFIQIVSNINAVNNNTSGIIVNNSTGPLTQGGVTSIVGKTVLTQPSANTTSLEYVGLRGWAYALSGDGGGLGSERANIYGATIVSSLQALASHIENQAAAEFAVETIAGSSVAKRAGIFLLNYAGDAVQGTIYDIGFGAWRYAAATSTSGYKVGWGIGNGVNFQPLATNAIAIKFSPGPGDSVTIANGIDFSLATITGFSFQFPFATLSGTGGMLATSFGSSSAGNATLNLISGGNAGFNFNSSDGTLFQVQNGTAGTAVATKIVIQAGVGGGPATISASGAASASVQFNSGASGGVVFQPGNKVFIDINGTTTIASTVQATGFKVGTNQVVGARQTGWAAMTGTPDIATAFATSTVTLAQLAGRVMSLQAALTTHGQIGP